ncbi:MAG TPA: regulatory iron-sulfur-containing complex subunit RicT [Gemmatimonadales bacterium]|jgi:cell fate regulator YaaT (PSP1 superfamily)|nr:regulatory iron-sulfur-containing complex subunit RicT [Gemmatimonadales bacterium]
MAQLVEVRFKGTRKAYASWDDESAPLRVGEAVVVEAERGRDLGRVTAVGEGAAKRCGSGCSGCAVGEAPAPGGAAGAAAEPPKPVTRRATRDDLRTLDENRRSEEDARRKVIERVRTHDLVMKVSDTEWQWDRNKLTIYFTAEKRVDFRALVRDLASLFRTRIELRQIGVRDEAARLSGVGRCGREYCCSSWLKELSPVNLGLAKDQHLSLNPSQISGGCGRLLCCLKYEHEFYVTARRRFPKEGKTVTAANGVERVIAVDIFRERVFLRSEEHGARIIPLVQLREEVEARGEVLLTAEVRGRMAITGDGAQGGAAERAPEAGFGTGPAGAEARGDEAPVTQASSLGDTSGAGSPAGPRPNRRRRRRRGGSGGTSDPDAPSGRGGTPPG